MNTHLQTLRKPRGDLLPWALDIREYGVSYTSGLKTAERALWLQRGPGIGTSTLAGYFIEHITENFPKSDVGYFFCLCGEQGMTSASDLIHTVSYQLAPANEPVWKSLDTFWNDDLLTKLDCSIEGLFDKMIAAPLTSVSKVVFFVLHGLDEADWDVDDWVSKDKTEMSILINCFSTLATTFSNLWLLLISRPEINAKTHVPEAIIDSLKYDENFEDIWSYIEIELTCNPELRSHFDQTDPRSSSLHSQGIERDIPLGGNDAS